MSARSRGRDRTPAQTCTVTKGKFTTTMARIGPDRRAVRSRARMAQDHRLIPGQAEEEASPGSVRRPPTSRSDLSGSPRRRRERTDKMAGDVSRSRPERGREVERQFRRSGRCRPSCSRTSPAASAQIAAPILVAEVMPNREQRDVVCKEAQSDDGELAPLGRRPARALRRRLGENSRRGDERRGCGS